MIILFVSFIVKITQWKISISIFVLFGSGKNSRNVLLFQPDIYEIFQRTWKFEEYQQTPYKLQFGVLVSSKGLAMNSYLI